MMPCAVAYGGIADWSVYKDRQVVVGLRSGVVDRDELNALGRSDAVASGPVSYATLLP